MLSAIVLIQNLRWLVPTAFLLGAAPVYISTWGIWRLLSAVFPHWVYVMGDDFMFSTYHRNLLFYFEKMTGVELVFYGDLDAIEELSTGENCIYMSNHQSTMDWIIANCVALRHGTVGSVRYVLKDGLKFLPLYGFYLGQHGSIFVKRAGKFQKEVAERQLRKDARDKKPMWLVIFPEGTRYNPELANVIADSKKFADSQGLEPFECVLYPRVRALQVCVEQLKDTAKCVYDVTIAYSGAFDFNKRQRKRAPSMQDFLMGWCPRVHIHITGIPLKEIPSDTKELTRWLHGRYQIKDRLMAELYSCSSEQESRFPGPHVVKALPLSALLPSVLFWTGSAVVINSFGVGRGVYWKVALGASLAGVVWAGVRY